MRDFSTIADRVEIEALRGEFTDAAMMRDYDRLTMLFTADGTLRMPHADVELALAGRRSAPGVAGYRQSSITFCKPPIRARSGLTATPRPAGRTYVYRHSPARRQLAH